MPVETNAVEIPCACDTPHETHFAYQRTLLGSRAVLEVFEQGASSEVAGVFRAIYLSLTDWDLRDANGDKLPITQQTVDDLRIEQINKLRPGAIAALKAGNTPLPNASGGRSAATSPVNRSQRRSAKKG